ncbi:hypothetical protein JCM18920_497 [Cutibacterium acnes JCM 18920]|nr:hypothetical protein JCM18909_2981 [Cutibacterium acnes JCM 18909]GAE78963.1 hypothetical protein JCM18920_497 [Cutibacterium acnes JCM 18920]
MPRSVDHVEKVSDASTSHGIRTAWDLMVIPRSRSISMRSKYWARALRSSRTQ